MVGNRRVGGEHVTLHQARRFEVLLQLFVLDPRVLGFLVIVDQVLPRRVHIFMRGEHGDQRAETDIAANREITTDRQEEKRRELREELIEDIDDVTRARDPHAQIENSAEAFGHLREFVLRGVVTVNFRCARDQMPDPIRNATHGERLATLQIVDALLNLRDHDDLQRVERDCRETHHPIL